MHELALSRRILETLQPHFPSGERMGIKSVTLKVGELTRVVPESLAFCFGLIAEGTPAQGAALKVETVPVSFRCRFCGTDFAAGRSLTVCEHCGESGVELNSGNELEVVGIELSELER